MKLAKLINDSCFLNEVISSVDKRRDVAKNITMGYYHNTR